MGKMTMRRKKKRDNNALGKKGESRVETDAGTAMRGHLTLWPLQLPTPPSTPPRTTTNKNNNYTNKNATRHLPSLFSSRQ